MADSDKSIEEETIDIDKSVEEEKLMQKSFGEPDDIVADEAVENLMLTMHRRKTARRESKEALNLKLGLCPK